MTIADKTILVTGANRGIGQALVTEALNRGAGRVYAGTRQPLSHPDPRVTPLTLDVTSAAQIRAAAGAVESLDVLINNAGIFDGLQNGEEDIFPDPYSKALADSWRGGAAKSLERELAGFVQS
jgi:NAD(P)-dependent dehydrogenase (short-subunit alcohol dehydrogenase family)